MKRLRHTAQWFTWLADVVIAKTGKPVARLIAFHGGARELFV